MDITAIILAAGVGRRLGELGEKPKVLLQVGGQTLLERHLRLLLSQGVTCIAITIGFDGGAIRAEVARLGLESHVRFVENPRYREGSLVSLSVQADLLRSGGSVLLMDGDVLYGGDMIARLLAGAGEGVLLVDRDIEPGDEPVKICFKDGVIVDFHKKPIHAHDWHGESVGFFRFAPRLAAALADQCDACLKEEGGAMLEYEEAIRRMIWREPAAFQAADISDLPWTEIDFAGDVARARDAILPRLTS